MNKLTLDVELAVKLKAALARNDWTEHLVDAACEGDILDQFRQVMLGNASITFANHVIDCDAEPFNPWESNGWKVVEHQRGGMVTWDKEAQKDAVYYTNGQMNGRIIADRRVPQLLEELSGKPVWNANALDHLLAYPHLIPEEWKRNGRGKYRCIFFLGTTYCNPDDELFARCLYLNGSSWCTGGDRLSYELRDICVALRA